MIGSFLALKSLLQISLNLIKQNIMSSKFVDLEFDFGLIMDTIPIYLGLMIVRRAASSSMQIFLVNNSKFFIIRL